MQTTFTYLLSKLLSSKSAQAVAEHHASNMHTLSGSYIWHLTFCITNIIILVAYIGKKKENMW